MSNLSTANLQHLLNHTTPEPWNVHTRDRHFDGETETWLYVGDTPASSIDYQLMSAAPELAQEVIRMREELDELLEPIRQQVNDGRELVMWCPETMLTKLTKIRGGGDE